MKLAVATVARLTPAALALLLTAPQAAAFGWPHSCEHTRNQLASPDESLRRAAASELTDLPAGCAGRVVLAALDHADLQVRLSAAEAARALEVPAAAERVLGWLGDSDARARLAAVEVLRASPLPRAAGPLGRVLSDPEPEVRGAAADALGALGSSDAVLALLGHMDDGSAQVRAAVFTALGKTEDARAVVPLIGKVQDPQASVRAAVAYALGELGDRRASSALLLALRDADEGVRVAAVHALGELRAADAVSALGSRLEQDVATPVKLAVTRALGQIASPEAQTALIAALESDTVEIATAARAELASIGEPAVPQLLACLQGPPAPSTASGCARALGETGSKRAGAAIAAALQQGLVAAPAALVALGEAGDPAHVPLVIERIGDPDPVTHAAALEAAHALLDPARPDGRVVEPLERALERARGNKSDRIALVDLLGRSGSARAARALTPIALSAKDLELRMAAVQALGWLGAAGQHPALLRALDDEEPALRWSAALALHRSAPAVAAAPILERLERRAEQDRAALAVALGGALSRSSDERVLPRVERLIRRASARERDALIEATARLRSERAPALLTELLLRSNEPSDRAKLAEALASRPGTGQTLRELSRSPHAAVRANAIWALGSVGTARDLPALERALGDRDVSVSANAVAALARAAQRARTPVVSVVCGRLGDARAYVRLNALAALRVLGARCADGRERRLLERDRSDEVRGAAALLLAAVPSPERERDARLLRRCAREDTSGSVATLCSGPPRALPRGVQPVTVYVVPAGESEPIARAPFALRLANGFVRLGTADRRGAVFEAAAPAGELSLGLPAPLGP